MQKVQKQSWSSALLPIGSKISQAIMNLEKSCMQIVLVVSEGNKLEGTLTDGDIRRALLKGFNLESDVNDIIAREPLVVPPEISKDFILQLMKVNKVQQLPIVNPKGVVIGLHLWDHVLNPATLPNTMIIMAGGKGTRLYPYTENCPKPMLDISGKPLLEHIIAKAAKEGFQDFIISLYHLGHMITEYFGDGRRFGVNINYLEEEAPLGTAGSLSLLSNVPQDPVVVTNGDVLTDVRYKEIVDYHSRHEAAATMAVQKYEMQNQFGVVRIRGLDIEAFDEKPIYQSYINAGVYVLEPDTLKFLKNKQYCDMPDLFKKIKMRSRRTIVYPMHEPWLDVGRPRDLSDARKLRNE